MGMAASQARLLAITARMHDLECQAQSIQNAKVQLATQSDQVYEEYLEALDATTLTVKTLTGTGTETITATFSNLCGKNKVDMAVDSRIGFVTKDGDLVVEDDIAAAYEMFSSGDERENAQAFALYMLGIEMGKENYIGEPGDDLLSEQEEAEAALYSENSDTVSDKAKNLHEKLEGFVGEDIYDTSELSEEDEIAYYETLEAYREELYKNGNSARILSKMCTDVEKEITPENFNTERYNYYLEKYKEIEACNGCVGISTFEGTLSGDDAANNSDWLQNMLKSGKLRLVNFKEVEGETLKSFGTVGSDSCLSYTTTTTIDKTALAKAEAEYEQKLKLIDRKDKQYDMTLTKLDTERKSLDAQRESLEKVIEDNINRTFKIFS